MGWGGIFLYRRDDGFLTRVLAYTCRDMVLTPILINAGTRRAQIHAKAIEGVQNVFPLEARGHRIEVDNVHILPKDYSSKEQKEAVLNGHTLQEPLKADVTLLDTVTGKVVQSKPGMTLAQIPWFTPRHTFIVDGNEYSVGNQRRVRPGVYTRVRGNEELEAAFNLGRGENFRISMDPAKGHMYLQYGTTNIPLYPILKHLGVTDGELNKAWGSGVVVQNKGAFGTRSDKALDRLYERLVPEFRRTHQTPEAKAEAIHESYRNTVLDPIVTQRTLGEGFTHVTPTVLVKASQKMLNVHRQGAETDDRDSLAVQSLHSVDDFLRERIQLEGRNLAKKVKMKASMTTTPDLDRIVPPSPFTRTLRSFITQSSLSAIPTQINPVEIYDSAVRVTTLGEGGIESERAIPNEARQLHHTHFGFIDPARTPESFKAGVDLRASLYLQRDEQGRMYTRLTNARTGKTEDVPVHQVENAVVAFPGEIKKKTGISALKSGQLVSVSRKDVDYELPHANLMFSMATNMVPMPESVQGNRILMGAKHATQALPLIHREQPLVQVASFNPGRTMEQEMANLVVPHAPVAGTIRKIDDDYIYLEPSGKKRASVDDPRFPPLAPVEYLWTTDDDAKYAEVPVPATTPMSGVDGQPQYDSGQVCDRCNNTATTKVMYNDGAAYKPSCTDCAQHIKEKLGDSFSGFRAFEKLGAAPNLIKIPYDSNYPLASKTYLHNELLVKAGDEVDEDQHLASSNFTRDGRMALGTNLNVGYLAHYGANTNDAVVISESAAEKLTSEHMYKEVQQLDDDITMSLDKHRALYGSRWTVLQYGHLDSRGVAKAGETLNPGDPIFLAIRKTSPTAEQQMLGKLHRGLAAPYREVAHTWDHRCSGVVTDVVVTPQRMLVTIKTTESAAVGDKISNRYGGKGVVSKVMPDSQMPRTPDGHPLELLMPPTGVHSRINPAQIIETALAKVARKTGEPIVMESMSGRNNVEYAKQMLKDHGLTDKEVLENPTTGKKITGSDGKGIMVGPQYIYKLFKSTETNYSARGVEDYDVNLQPAKGGASGAKALGRMELNALLAHNARNVLKEVSTLKSTKNDEFWRAYQLGLPPPPVRTSFAAEKLMEMLRGSGIKVDKSAQHLTLGPMTDADIKQMSSGAITKSLMVKEKDLTPEKGGLFDPVVTGGTAGTRWAHVDLHEPIVNPVFEDPVRRLLGMTENQFRDTLQKEGGKGIQRRLAKLNLDAHATALKEEIRDASGARLDNVVKQLKALQALKQQDLTADQAYVLSKLPIVPPVIRPILPSKGRRDLLVADANYLYRDAILANDTLADAKRVLPEEEVGKARLQLYDATKAVFGLADPTSPQLSGRGAKGFISTITGQGSPKQGFFHGKVLYRPQDLSGRGTVAPDLTLDMDEIGLPEDMLWTTYAPHIIRRLVQNGYKAVDAKQLVDDRHPAAHDMLQRELRERPVFVNRAPTLHRYNLIGAYPVAVPGKTIRVNPFMEQGMGMDYDGDTLQVHVPVGTEAVKEVRSMTLSNLLFGDKSKNNLLVFPQHEAIIGVHMASAAHGGTTHRFKTKADAIAAYKQGEIKLTDTVDIG
jgi:DNA-directed RNA polymerase beta subunit